MTTGEKLGRNYELTITDIDGTTLIIEPPFTIELDITRHTLASSNCCQIRIYNLALENRDFINFNAYNQSIFKGIQLKAGYGENLAIIFNGNISQAWSAREGVNFITQIECYDGGFASVNGTVDLSFVAGTPIKDVITTLIQNLPEISLGGVGNFEGTLARGNTYSGNIVQILTELTGGAFFIDNGKGYALKNNEYLTSEPIVEIDDTTGLLNTPRLEQSTVHFEMIFEPTLNAGSLANVDSSTFPGLNGVYTITGVKHRGIISEVVSGDLITIGEFFYSGSPEGISP